MVKKKETIEQSAVETPSPLAGDGEGEGALNPQSSILNPGVCHVANLDVDGVYWGVIEKHCEDLTDADFAVPANCDLAPGKYRLNRDPARIGGPGFDPLERSKQKQAPTAPTFERALYDLIVNPDDHKYAIEWAKWYETTMEAPTKR
jgi:hypothetical protein